MEEKKKRFIDPVIWAKYCFILVLIEIGIILFGLTGFYVPPLNLFLAYIFPIVLIGGGAGGLITLIGLLIIKERRKKLYIQASTAVLVSIIIPVLVSYAYKQGHNVAIEIVCRSNMKYLCDSILESGNVIFKKELWCDLIEDTVEYENTFNCFRDKTGPCSYAMNENIPADANELPGDLVLLFESAPGWNQTGGPDDVVTDRHNNPSANIAFADGHVEFVEADSIPTLRWMVKE